MTGLEPGAQVIATSREPDERDDPIAHGHAVQETIQHVKIPAGKAVDDRPDQRIETKGLDRQQVDRGRSGASRHLGRTLERDRSPGPCLPHGLQRAAKVHRDQQRIQGVDSTQIGPSEAGHSQVPPID